MKKVIIALVTFTLLYSTEIVFAQTTPASGDVVLLNVNRYYSYFSIIRRKDIIDSDYVWEASDEEIVNFGALNWNGRDDDTALVDTPLEFALLSYYSPAVIQIRPVEANRILPADNPRLTGLRLGAATYKELLVLRFLTPNDTAAISRYENMIRFIQDRSGVTRAGIETYFRDGIRGFVNEIVNEEFNKISFTMGSPTGGYNAVLIYNPQNGHYVLRYEDARNVTKELTGASLETLSSAMSRSGDFSQAATNTVRAQATLIQSVSSSTNTRNEIVNLITAFYLNPNRNTVDAIRTRYEELRRLGELNRAIANSFLNALYELNPLLGYTVVGD